MSATVAFLLPDGTRRNLAIAAGTNVMQAALNAGLPGIIGECGGAAMCATCHVYVEAGGEALPPVSETENAMLEFTASERRSSSRLSCQLIGVAQLDGVVLSLPEQQT